MTGDELRRWRRQGIVVGVLALACGWGIIQFAVGGMTERELEARYARIVEPESCTRDVQGVLQLNWGEIDETEVLDDCLVIIAQGMEGPEELMVLLRNSGFTRVEPITLNRRDSATMERVDVTGVSATMPDELYPKEIASWWVRFISWQLSVQVRFSGPSQDDYPNAYAHFQIE